MTTEVQAAPAAPVQQQQQENAPMSAESQAALVEVQRLMGTYGATPSGERDALAEKISSLQRYSAGHGEKPAWYLPTPDTRMTDTRPHDPLSEKLADAARTITPQERSDLLFDASVRGLPSAHAVALADFAERAQLDRVTAKAIITRAAHHNSMGFGFGEQLTESERSELAEQCLHAFGSQERYERENGLAYAYLKHVGLEQWSDQHAGSLSYDARAITALAYRARVLGLQPHGGK